VWRLKTLLCRKLLKRLAYKTGEMMVGLILVGQRWISTVAAGPKDRPCRKKVRASRCIAERFSPDDARRKILK
jgi:hypothetical protein